MATYTSIVTCGTVNLNGTFDYTPPNPPTSPNGSVVTEYTLTNGNTLLSTTNGSSNGSSVQFSVTTGGTTYNFHGAYAAGTGRIVGKVTPCTGSAGDPDNWTASA